MANKYDQNKFSVANPEKYSGKKVPFYRSSWERKFMEFCDTHPNVLSWASEAVRIPYKNPLTGKSTTYVPDFLIHYQDKDGQDHIELIEIKPEEQTAITNRSSEALKQEVAINAAKWEAAKEWAMRKGIGFRVLNKHHIFLNVQPKSASKKRK